MRFERFAPTSFLFLAIQFVFAFKVALAESPTWNYTFDNTKNEFEFSVQAGSESYELRGTLLRASTGFLKQVISQIQVNQGTGTIAPTTNTKLFGLELPRVMTIQPPILGTEYRPTFAVSTSGACPTRDMSFNFVVARSSTVSRNNMASPYQPAFGTFSWNSASGTATVNNIRSVADPSTNVISSFSLSGNSCTGGTVSTTGAGDLGGSWSFSLDFAGFYHTNADNGFFFFPQAAIAQSYSLSGSYAVIRSETVAYNSESLSYATATLSNSVSSFSAQGLQEPDDAEAIVPGDSLDLVIDSINSPFPGMFQSHISGTSSKLVCMVHFSSQAAIYCTGQSPNDANRLYTLTMLRQVRSFQQSRGFDGTTKVVRVDGVDRILVAGSFMRYGTVARSRLARFLTDGTLDPSYDPGTGPNGSVDTLAIDADGKAIIGGAFTSVSGVARNRLARINADGTLDTTFNPGSGFDVAPLKLILDASGRVLVGGNFTTYDGVGVNRVIRLNTDGSLDSSFNTGTGPGNVVQDVRVDSSARIYISGAFTSVNSIAHRYVSRLNSNGAVDTTFVPSTTVRLANSVVPLADGKILVGGSHALANYRAILRLNSDGSLDTTFNNPTTGTISTVREIVVGEGSYLLGGSNIIYNGVRNFMRLTTSGAFDTSFVANNYATSELVNSIAVDSRGRIFVAGRLNAYSGEGVSRVMALDASGNLLPWFSRGGGAAGNFRHVATIVPTLEGKLFIGGYFTVFDGVPRGGMARLNLDGTVDGSFETLGGFAAVGSNYSGVTSVLEYPGGKYVLTGNFDSYRGVTIPKHIGRFNYDGSIDTTFNPGTGASNSISRAVKQPDGKILIVGGFSTYAGVARTMVARLTSNGALDTTFQTTITGTNLYDVKILDDGKILIGGSFTAINGTGQVNIARLNTDGTLDSTFNSGTGPSAFVSTIAVGPDGKYYVGGAFVAFNGALNTYLVRLNTDGTLDPSFASQPLTPTGDANVTPGVVALAFSGTGPSAKLYIGGNFNLNGVAARVYRVEVSDGSLDTTFPPIDDSDLEVFCLTLQSDGKLLMGGDMFGVRGYSASGIVRILSTGQVD